MDDLKIARDDLTTLGIVLQIGLPPNRIDFLTAQTRLGAFDAAWTDRVTQQVRRQQVPFLGRVALLTNKRATGRTRDLADVEALEQWAMSARTRTGRCGEDTAVIDGRTIVADDLEGPYGGAH